MKRSLAVLTVILLLAGALSAQQPPSQAPTDADLVAQARALIAPIEARVDGATRTNLRHILTRMQTLIAQLQSTQTSEPEEPTPQPDPQPEPRPEPEPDLSPHAYFEALRQLPQHVASWSLRDQAQLDALVQGAATSTFFTYDPANDSYPGAQDAAKFYVPAGRDSANIPISQQLKMPLPRVDSGSLLVTWDWYWGPEFRTQRGGMNHYKVFKFLIGGHAAWTLMHSPSWAKTDDEVAKVWDSLTTPAGPPDGLITREPWTPAGLGAPDQRNKSGEQVGIYPHTWMRYWVEIRLFQPHTAFTDWNTVTGQTLRPNPNDPEGRWHMVSLWFADERQEPRRLLYRIPMGWAANWSPHVSEFIMLMNTSQTSGFIGPWVGYGRNVVVLHNYPLTERDSVIFQQPEGSAPSTAPDPTPAPVEAHQDYDALCALPGAQCYSLRDPAQLATRQNGGYSQKNSAPPSCTYDPEMDAAKCVIPQGRASLENQVRLPIPDHTGQSLLVRWDAYFDESWIGGGIPDQKTWQLSCGSQDIHTEIRNRYQQGQKQRPGSIAKVDGRQYSLYGPNVIAHGTLAPMAGEFFVMPHRWTRWVAHLRAPRDGSQWYEYSLWVADEQTEPVLVYDRLQIAPCGGRWDRFWLEFNTSSNDRKTVGGDLTAWVKNVLMVIGPGADEARPFIVKP